MIFNPAGLSGAYIIDMEPITDDRGFFARAWCRDTFEKRGLKTDFVQSNNSFSRSKGTLRGLHYQVSPYQEAKLVRCIKGAIYDVMIDVRPDSETYAQWFGIELNAENRRMIYMPEGIAHGFLTLQDETEILYNITQSYHPECERGIRYNDPSIKIKWPRKIEVVTEKDLQWPDFEL